MTRTYFTKTVISERHIVITTQILGEEHQSVVTRGLQEDQQIATAIITHKEAADVAFGIAPTQQIQQRQNLNQKVQKAGDASVGVTS